MNSLLYFTADWCNPCKKVRPIIEEIEEENSITVLYINVDESIELCKKFNIKSVPTFVLLKCTEEFKRTTGSKTKKELEDFING